MKLSSKDVRVAEGDKGNLGKCPTAIKPVYESKDRYENLLSEHVTELSAFQQALYASNSHAVLLIFQATDAAGKDGVIKHVMSGVNPQGCQVVSFKHPSDYMDAHEQCLHATSTDEAPWYVIPAYDKENARLIVSHIVVDTLESLEMAYPTVSEQRRAELLAFRTPLEA